LANEHTMGTMRMSEEQLREIVKTRIRVTHQDVAIAKGLLLKHFHANTDAMITSALNEIGLTRPDRLVVKGDADSTTDVQRLGDYFSWSLCAVEALWGLIHAGVVIPSSTSMNCIGTAVQVTYIWGGSSSSGGEDFGTIVQIPGFPQTVVKSQCQTDGFVLTDPGLYLQALRPQVPPGDIAEALRESIRCFRAELYLACAVMLGKASEGIWIELGKSLVDALPKSEQTRHAKFRIDLDSSIRPSFAAKLKDIVKLYETAQKEFAHLAASAGLGLDQFRLAAQWADLVRDSRNVIHYGSQPNIPNNYTNVSTLLLAGSTHFRNLLMLHAAAVAHPGT
jgi:hypothetical protein